MKQFLGYQVSEHGRLINAPCGCYQCSDNGWQAGHPYCNNVPAELVKAEEDGKIFRRLETGWNWYVA